VDPIIATGQREEYPAGPANDAPVIRMGFQTTPGVNSVPGLVLGFFMVNALYSVRGRRAGVLPSSTQFALMNTYQKNCMVEVCAKYCADHRRGNSTERGRESRGPPDLNALINRTATQISTLSLG